MEEGPRLRLGPRVLSYLVDRYNSWNQSVEEFVSGIKVLHPRATSDKVRVHVPLLREPFVCVASSCYYRPGISAYISNDDSSQRHPFIALHAEIHRRQTRRKGHRGSQVAVKRRSVSDILITPIRRPHRDESTRVTRSSDSINKIVGKGCEN